jgi:quercetin dioxygenase-like cupin family protein
VVQRGRLSHDVEVAVLSNNLAVHTSSSGSDDLDRRRLILAFAALPQAPRACSTRSIASIRMDPTASTDSADDLASVVTVDLSTVHGSGGVLWSVSPLGFHANLVGLAAGESVESHRNDDVDVLIVVLAGRAELTVDGSGVDLTRGMWLSCRAAR